MFSLLTNVTQAGLQAGMEEKRNPGNRLVPGFTLFIPAHNLVTLFQPRYLAIILRCLNNKGQPL